MLGALKEIINPDVILDRDEDKQRILLKENGAGSNIKKLYITNIPDHSLAFTLDHQPPGGKDKRYFQQLSPYINKKNDKGVNKSCDLIILWQKNDKIQGLVFDLKSDKPKVEATQKQLNNSELYLRYLLSMIWCHYEIEATEVTVKKIIGTTDDRALRKSATYRPNSEPSKFKDCYVKPLTVKAYNTAYISLSELSNSLKPLR